MTNYVSGRAQLLADSNIQLPGVIRYPRTEENKICANKLALVYTKYKYIQTHVHTYTYSCTTVRSLHTYSPFQIQTCRIFKNIAMHLGNASR